MVCISYLIPPPRKALIPRYISRNFVVGARSTSAPQKPTRIWSETGEMLTQIKRKKHFHSLGIYSFTNTKELHIQLLPEYIYCTNKINNFIIKLVSFYKRASIISIEFFLACTLCAAKELDSPLWLQCKTPVVGTRQRSISGMSSRSIRLNRWRGQQTLCRIY